MTENITDNLQKLVLASIFSALMAAGAVGPMLLNAIMGPGAIPFVLTTFFVVLAGSVLGKKWGTTAAAVYITAGMFLPVFANGGSGISQFAGPTGGYLLGYVPAAFVTGLICERSNSVYIIGLGIFAGMGCIYALGIPVQLIVIFSRGGNLIESLVPIPFYVVGDIVKALVAVTVTQAVRPLLANQNTSMEEQAG